MENFILVRDEYRQVWKVLPGDPLWEAAKTKHEAGEDPIVFPLALISERRGWGWWTVFQNCSEWIASIGVPLPTVEELPPPDTLMIGDLSGLLQCYGGYLAYLETILGQVTGQRNALKESYEAAVMVATAKLDGKLTERAKEASILETNQTLRQTKRRFIEEDAKLYYVKGMRDAYKALWDSVSRILTARALEASLATGRTP